jgi:hypothetical protein
MTGMSGSDDYEQVRHQIRYRVNTIRNQGLGLGCETTNKFSNRQDRIYKPAHQRNFSNDPVIRGGLGRGAHPRESISRPFHREVPCLLSFWEYRNGRTKDFLR